MDIRSSVTAVTSTAGLAPQRDVPQNRPDRASPDPEPAASVERGSDASEMSPQSRGYVRDLESRALVFQVTDPVSGDVIVQIPDAVVVKARAYTRQSETTLAEAATGSRIARTV